MKIQSNLNRSFNGKRKDIRCDVAAVEEEKLEEAIST